MVDKLKKLMSQKGFFGSIKAILYTVFLKLMKSLLNIPIKKIGVYNGVIVRNVKLFNKTDIFHNYEDSEVRAINKYVKPDDNVVIVGGGFGVTTVIAAKKLKESNKMTLIEASKTVCTHIIDTLKLNNVYHKVNIINKVVEVEHHTWGKTETNNILLAKDLPTCDVLILDCEGAEKQICENITFSPTYIFVETHRQFEAPLHLIESILKSRNYKILNKETEQNGIGYLIAKIS